MRSCRSPPVPPSPKPRAPPRILICGSLHLAGVSAARKRLSVQTLSLIALVVRDYDEAIAYFTRVLDFELIEDTTMSPTKRWVVVAPQGSKGARILLAKAAGATQRIPHRRSNRRPRLSLPRHRRFRARPQEADRPRRQIRPRTEQRAVRLGRRLRRSLRQQVGSGRTPRPLNKLDRLVAAYLPSPAPGRERGRG